MKVLLVLFLLFSMASNAQTVATTPENAIHRPDDISIGAEYEGGIIAYILQPGDSGYDPVTPHGLIAAPNDLAWNMKWGPNMVRPVGAAAIKVGTGAANTDSIIANCGSDNAAYMCRNLTYGGFNDWYLPSKNELNKLFIYRAKIGGFAVSGYYWSSSEVNGYYAWYQHFNLGNQSSAMKTSAYLVRAVRTF
jgi:hypothetical protein